MRRAIVGLLSVLVPCAPQAFADLTAVFAFDEALVSASMPRLDYRIATTVDQTGRYVLIATPARPPGSPAPGDFQIEMYLEAASASLDSEEISSRFLLRYHRDEGLEYVSLPVEKIQNMLLEKPEAYQVFYSDSQLRSHKGILVFSVQNGIAMVVLFDTLSEEYDEVEEGALGIIRTIHVGP